MKLKTLSFRVTDRQSYFLKEIARSDHRTLEQLLYILLEEGTFSYLECRLVSVKKRTEDFTKEELDKIAIADKAQEQNKPCPADCYVHRYFDNAEIEKVLESLTDNILSENDKEAELSPEQFSKPGSEVEPDL